MPRLAASPRRAWVGPTHRPSTSTISPPAEPRLRTGRRPGPGLEDDRLDAAGAEAERRGEAREAGADDRDVGAAVCVEGADGIGSLGELIADGGWMSMRLVAVFGRPGGAFWWRPASSGPRGGLVPAGAAAATIGSDLKGSPSRGSGYSCGKGLELCAAVDRLPGDVKTKAPFTAWSQRAVPHRRRPEAAGWKVCGGSL